MIVLIPDHCLSIDLEGLSLPRNSMVRSTEHSDMTIAL